MEGRRVAITGIGLITPFGVGIGPFWNGLMERRSAVRPPESFDPTGLPVNHFGELPRIEFDRFLDPRATVNWSRASKVAAVAAKLAAEDARLQVLAPYRAGMLLGTGFGCTYELEASWQAWRDRGPRGLKPITIPRSMPNAPASHIAIQHGLRGPNMTISTACSSGAVAVALAAQQIRAGRLDVCLTGGVDVLLNVSTVAAWSALGVLSLRNDPTACRPFSVDRDGLVLAEGCAILVLEAWDDARARGARSYAEIRGAAINNDAHHIVAPDAAAEEAVIREALADAGIAAAEIGYVNAHGTGTIANDATESRVLKQVFGRGAAATPVSSIKGHMGHGMGAAGAIEVAATALALEHQRIPPTLHFEPGDPECDLDYVADGPREARFAHALTTSFGFGGQNAAVVLSRRER